ncbi:hypothetical protein YTPLAS18_29070 [Nitrospira sp.]|nr:hypothetical protein YTPLAS18_29070 [Nitrospira sp.]
MLGAISRPAVEFEQGIAMQTRHERVSREGALSARTGVDGTPVIGQPWLPVREEAVGDRRGSIVSE